jgi:hypothetical protein
MDEQGQQLAEHLLERRLRDLGDRVDTLETQSAGFVDLAKNCYISIRRTQHEEKLRAAVNVLTNAMLRKGDEEKLPYNELDHFARCVENLPLAAIRVLGQYIAYARLTIDRRDRKLRVKNVRVDFGSFRAQHPEMDADLLLGLFGELNGYNLVHLLGVPSARLGDADKKYGNYPIETTPLGYRFVNQILEPGAALPSGP